jgi:hypothetical protein
LNEDIDFLIKTIEEVHPNPYVIYNKDKFYNEVNDLRNSIDHPMTRKEFALLLRPLIRLLQTDHTSVKLPWEEYDEYKNSGGLIFPFDVTVDDTQITLAKNYSFTNANESNNILSINGISANDIITDLKNLYGIEEIQRQFRFLLWLNYSFEGPFTIEVEDTTFNTPGLTASEILKIQEQQKSSPPKYVRYKYENLGEQIGLLVVNSYGGDSQKFDAFVKQSFTQMQKDSITNLIIDIRNNDGGRSELVSKLINYIWDKPYKMASRFERKRSKQFDQKLDEIMAWWLTPMLRIHPYMKDYYKTPYGQVAITKFDEILPDENPLRFYGKVYVLISPYTYSSAHEFACIIKDYKMGILIGQETGSRQPGSDAYEFILPHSRLWARSATAFSVRPSGITNAQGVKPDFKIQPKIDDINQNIDTIMEFTKQLIKKEVG